ncbi:MAG: hypothetical protein KDK38_10345, partial [Leptospiraceae bacterium]|nr:hypothetical protein [Leptospiraceae bacterium]
NELLPALKNSNVEIQLTPLQTLLKITFLSELHTVKKLSKELHKSMLKRGYYLPPVKNPVISFNFATSENDIGNFSRALLKSLQNI